MVTWNYYYYSTKNVQFVTKQCLFPYFVLIFLKATKLQTSEYTSVDQEARSPTMEQLSGRVY